VATPFNSGLSLGSLLVDGHAIVPTSHQWIAYEASRRGQAAALEVTSHVRLAFEGPMLMFELHFNRSRGVASAANVSIELDMHPLIRQYDAFPWVQTYPNITEEFHFSNMNVSDTPSLLTIDTKSAATSVTTVSASGFSMQLAPVVNHSGGIFRGTLGANVDSAVLRVVIAVGNHTSAVLKEAASMNFTSTSGFDTAWARAASGWEDRWADAFTPDNKHYSGHLPSVVSENEDLSRIYYNSILTVISLERVNLPLVAPRVYLTSSGNALPYNCSSCLPHINGILEIGGSAMYYWDAKQVALVLSLLDPVSFRASIVAFLTADADHSNGLDLYSGKPFGAWYAFNSYSIFRCIATYVQVADDHGFLHEIVHGRSVNAWLEKLSLDWTTRSFEDEPNLADYGGFAGDFLECVPTYTNGVAALQAFNVRMMRDVATLRDHEASQLLKTTTLPPSSSSPPSTASSQLLQSANATVAAMFKQLYVEPPPPTSPPTNDNITASAISSSSSSSTSFSSVVPIRSGAGGYWATLLPNKNRVEVRHVLDFHAVGISLGGGSDNTNGEGDLSATMRTEMAQFFTDELWRRGEVADDGGPIGWPIALSRQDALKYIDRPDHGTNGAYGSWPPLSFEALTVIETSFANSLPFLLSTVDSAHQGPYGQDQAVQVVGPPRGAKDVRAFKTIAGATRYTAVAGGAFADCILRRIFGYQPGWSSLSLPSSAGGDRNMSEAFWMRGLNRTISAELRNLRIGATGQQHMVTVAANYKGLQVTPQKPGV
jgi:hypothetical protein